MALCGRLRRCSPAGGSVSLWAGFESLRPHPTSSSPFMLVGEDVSSPLLVLPAVPPAFCHEVHAIMPSASRSLSQNWRFLSQVALVLVLCYDGK